MTLTQGKDLLQHVFLILILLSHIYIKEKNYTTVKTHDIETIKMHVKEIK